MSKEIRQRPFLTGFCSMNNHDHCLGVIGNGRGRTILCTCTCHVSQIEPEPMLVNTEVWEAIWNPKPVSNRVGPAAITSALLVHALHRAIVSSLCKLLAPTTDIGSAA